MSEGVPTARQGKITLLPRIKIRGYQQTVPMGRTAAAFLIIPLVSFCARFEQRGLFKALPYLSLAIRTVL
jgi:hypothetical protein